MSKVSAVAVKELRGKTGAGIMDCKNALLEAKGDSELAIDILRTKGAMAASKREGRKVSEGLIGIARDGYKKASIVEVNVETDSLAKNTDFQSLVSNIAGIALSTDGSLDNVLAMPFDHSGITVGDGIKQQIAITGECIKLRRSALLCVSEGVISSYLHASPSEGLGSIGVLVALQSSAEDKELLSAIGEKIAVHVMLASPSVISVQMLDPSIVANKRAHYMTEALDSGKSGNIVEKIVNGKMQSFCKECVLLHQGFVVDPSKTVSDFLKESEKSIGASIEVVGVSHFVVGKENDDG
ncbi:translation elongation factor Ts [Candidatus Liberibacter asiaticus]|uniref:Elongation factor Ts n=2 Tax=Liberibacter asiaticus TaxID=34021 RepID=C6XFU8_LIBAP|nr:translation elongation factor Ts [Candidatus Liberibacter asiaticus]ACT57251.1 elongation factor Ts [Candidatus Liberibacter asiaticus str. psy62]AGH16786.1 elongation factor Ts [Candidatus Liberibacter asiaticus str. gxpsy]ALK07151.1 translation elongation factor Ts [Candidatus Liberibacter asiaticus]ASK52628.1 translation elongation factor Ts [Candidatus Liberibacter asiaticus]AWL13953.1 translation elongation factor Ts [Candidatus Liberibacter asiaticus]